MDEKVYPTLTRAFYIGVVVEKKDKYYPMIKCSLKGKEIILKDILVENVANSLLLDSCSMTSEIGGRRLGSQKNRWEIQSLLMGKSNGK
ncbi:hypothetical protein SESBI_28408 [Sesbania bispinosa]|nr:hypothetical protein SESBI_28408 [Sesbania bispinosa]